MEFGCLYGVSVGPGDPELITLKALGVLERCPVVAAPRTTGGRTAALDIAAGAADLSKKRRLLLDFPMDGGAESSGAYVRAADSIEAELRAGRDVAFVNLGDVSVFSTWGPLSRLLAERGYETRGIPGVPSFCAAASALGMSLTEGGALHVLAGDSPQALELAGTKVFLKSGRGLSALGREIERRGLLPRTAGAENCGLPEERLFRGCLPEEAGYFTTVLVGD